MARETPDFAKLYCSICITHSQPRNVCTGALRPNVRADFVSAGTYKDLDRRKR
jgi:hypothetical protein